MIVKPAELLKLYQTTPEEMFELDQYSKVLYQPSFEYARLRNFDKLLDKYGKVYANCAFTDESIPIAGSFDSCHEVSGQLAMKHEDLSYVEGFIFVYGWEANITMAHAWNVRGKIIIDATMSQHQHKPFIHYHGIRINKEYLKKWKETTGHYSLIDGNLQDDKIGIYYDNPELWLAK